MFAGANIRHETRGRPFVPVTSGSIRNIQCFSRATRCRGVIPFSPGPQERGKQVIKCEKSEVGLGSPFWSAGFPNAAAQRCPPGRAGRAMGVPEQPPRCRPPLGTQRALSGPSKPAMSCSSGLASRQPEKLRWAEPCILQQAFCPGAPLSRGRCPGPRGGGRRPKWTRKSSRKRRGGQGNAA